MATEEKHDGVTVTMPENPCAVFGCVPIRVIADNGYTYETICGTCGKSK